ncbi:helix-turn-helix domain-containing protein [Paracoccus sp. M683]|uniref:IclR family transcriptional regulator n=1 Tax=Paracoccus sp. M683 TaxID=2594268 RepID=UPI0011801638|nr:helix-turn-helix domain-containing protein [Paracoccus sp. M683]TRW93040.1 helix-turn-helix domain-containing protein [Paracoccus sp. M683]
MSGLDRFVAVLSLYSETVDLLSVQEIADYLDMPSSTVYRIVRDLVKASFLEPATGARYRLGSAFPAYDWVARKADPVVRVAGPLMHEIVLQSRTPCVVLLARLSSNMVMCIGHEASSQVDFEWSLFERGRPIPLTRGSSSQVILAQLPALQRRKLLMAQAEDKAEAQRLAGENEHFSQIRKRGFVTSTGEIDPALSALAAPIAVPEIGIFASIGMICDSRHLTEDCEQRLALLLMSSAGLVTERLRRDDQQTARTTAAD